MDSTYYMPIAREKNYNYEFSHYSVNSRIYRKIIIYTLDTYRNKKNTVTVIIGTVDKIILEITLTVQ